MKTKFWIATLAVVLVICALSGYLLLAPGAEATQARILQDGQVVRTVDLRFDQEFTVTSENGGYNVITVSGGRIAVTDASCPDHYCAQRGFCSGGADIICLPNRVVIRFLEESEVDAVIG